MTDLQIPLTGMNSAATSLDRTAVKIAKSADPSSGDQLDLSDSVIQMLQSRTDFSANVTVAQTFDQMQRSVLNIFG